MVIIMFCYTQIEEVVDVVTSAAEEDIFQSFDVKLSGTIPFPRVDKRFFEYKYSMPLAGFMILSLCKLIDLALSFC